MNDAGFTYEACVRVKIKLFHSFSAQIHILISFPSKNIPDSKKFSESNEKRQCQFTKKKKHLCVFHVFHFHIPSYIINKSILYFYLVFFLPFHIRYNCFVGFLILLLSKNPKNIQ